MKFRKAPQFTGKTKKYKALEIIDSGARTEEVIVDQEKNHYFITSMAIDGTSWAKNVRFINK